MSSFVAAALMLLRKVFNHSPFVIIMSPSILASFLSSEFIFFSAFPFFSKIFPWRASSNEIFCSLCMIRWNSARRAASLSLFTSTHFPLSRASPSVISSSFSTSWTVMTSPSSINSGFTESTVWKPMNFCDFSPSFIFSLIEADFFFHHIGIRQRIPDNSISGMAFKKLYVSWGFSLRVWNISPLSTISSMNFETSAALLRQASRASSLPLLSLYSVSANFNGLCVTVESWFLTA